MWQKKTGKLPFFSGKAVDTVALVQATRLEKNPLDKNALVEEDNSWLCILYDLV